MDKRNAALRNVTGELFGMMIAINWGIRNGYKAATIYHDYADIANWATGE